MKRFSVIILSATLILGVSTTAPTETELNKTYKGGVAKAANIKNKGEKTKFTPFVSKEIYEANIKSDRDKDGIACEK